MFTYVVMSVLVILVLIKLNFRAIYRLKCHQHEMKNIQMLIEQKEELWDSSFKYKRLSKIQEYRIEQLNMEIKRQQKINFVFIERYNSIRESVIDVPLKNGRFFAVNINKEKLLLHFSEN